jgi:hypothetical protein
MAPAPLTSSGRPASSWWTDLVPLPSVFVADTPAWTAPVTDPAALRSVAVDTLRYLEAARGVDPLVTGDADIVATLRALAAAPSVDPAWLGRCFQAYRWHPDSTRWGGELRLTRYLVYEVEGAGAADSAHPRALWAVPHDEAGLSEAEAQARSGELLRYRYTRQDVAAGVYDVGGASAGAADPLVWLSQEAHEQALLQGTTAVQTPEGVRLFNVDRSNGIPYDRALSDTTKQRRYWYFRETDRVRGWGVAPVPKIALAPEVAVAGDLAALGLGRVFALRSDDGVRIVVLADTGGAFEGNLHQLDLYSGIFPSASAFHAATDRVGDTAEAWALVVREGVDGCGG